MNDQKETTPTSGFPSHDVGATQELAQNPDQLIAAAQDLEQLFLVLDQIGVITGRDGKTTYQPAQMKLLIAGYM